MAQSNDEVKPTPVGEFEYKPAVTQRNVTRTTTGAQSNGDEELRRFIVQETAYMTAKGIKSGVFEDWTVANKIADKVLLDRKQHELDARIDILDRIDARVDEDEKLGRFASRSKYIREMRTELKAERERLGK